MHNNMYIHTYTVHCVCIYTYAVELRTPSCWNNNVVYNVMDGQTDKYILWLPAWASGPGSPSSWWALRTSWWMQPLGSPLTKSRHMNPEGPGADPGLLTTMSTIPCKTLIRCIPAEKTQGVSCDMTCRDEMDEDIQSPTHACLIPNNCCKENERKHSRMASIAH